MSYAPTCPYCNTDLDEPIPQALQGSIQVRCPSCGLLYSYSQELGSLPIEDEFNYQLSPSLFGKKITVGPKTDMKDLSRDSNNRTCIYLCLVSPFLILVALLVFVLVLSMLNS